jgi:hypothetical protein
MPTSSFRRENGESRAIQGAECYCAHPLLSHRPIAMTFLRTAALPSASDGYSRSEAMYRE